MSRRLLTDSDYDRIIQQDNLEQIIQSNYNLLLGVEQAAQSLMIGYLKSRYLTDKIFTNTTFFSTGTTYYANDLVQYTSPTYLDSINYSINDHVAFSGVVYTCIIPTTGQTAPNSATTNWSAITTDGNFYFAIQPCPSYDYKRFYNVGEQVFFDNCVYQATQNVRGVLPGQSTNLMERYNNVPNYTYSNFNSTNPVPSANTQSWEFISGYSFTNIYCEDSNYWDAGDNRNQLIVQHLLSITLYYIHLRLSPRNIPQLRYEQYCGNSYETGGAVGWLKATASGDVFADLPEIILPEGISISWGSNPRNRVST